MYPNVEFFPIIFSNWIICPSLTCTHKLTCFESCINIVSDLEIGSKLVWFYLIFCYFHKSLKGKPKCPEEEIYFDWFSWLICHLERIFPFNFFEKQKIFKFVWATSIRMLERQNQYDMQLQYFEIKCNGYILVFKKEMMIWNYEK